MTKQAVMVAWGALLGVPSSSLAQDAPAESPPSEPTRGGDDDRVPREQLIATAADLAKTRKRLFERSTEVSSLRASKERLQAELAELRRVAEGKPVGPSATAPISSGGVGVPAAAGAGPGDRVESKSDAGPLSEDAELLHRPTPIPPDARASHDAARKKWWTTESAMTMSSVVLLFGALVIVASALLALRRLGNEAVLKVVTIPMVVVSAVFLVVAGYSDQQMAPAMGLLGTIVGYVLGSPRQPLEKEA